MFHHHYPAYFANVFTDRVTGSRRGSRGTRRGRHPHPHSAHEIFIDNLRVSMPR